jgi:hypothetical protein
VRSSTAPGQHNFHPGRGRFATDPLEAEPLQASRFVRPNASPIQYTQTDVPSGITLFAQTQSIAWLVMRMHPCDAGYVGTCA